MLEKVQSDRLKKLEAIRELGIDPYGARYDTREPITSILARHAEDADGHSAEGQTADAAGRLVLIRDMGKMIFAHIRDESGQMQIALRKNAVGEATWRLAKLLDLGDIVAAAGPLQKTRTGEITIWAEGLTLLCKSLNPMPEKWHGLTDTEARYRQRYVDLMTNPESMARFQKRVAIIERIRSLLRARGFIEVETPILQAIYGGGAARPFTTHHNTLDADLYLRISPELYLKRLLVGGMERVFEIGRNFRNEGIDTRHNPEFTMMELYQAYADYEVMMEITEQLVTTCAREITVPAVIAEAERLKARIEALRASEDAEQKALAETETADAEAMFKAAEGIASGKLTIPYGQRVLDLTSPWPRRKYDDLLLEHAGVSMHDGPAARAKALELGIEESNKADAVVVNEVFEETVEPALGGGDRPTFVIDYPADICPLTRRRADDSRVAMRFEVFCAGMELGNAYTELNDPAVQEANFTEQLAGEGEAEAMRKMDEDFVTALRHGMPPAGGLGIGIDRVIMLLTDTPSIRDVVLFPMLRSGPK